MCPLQQSYDRAEFEALTGKYEKLNWRMISKPGGATVKPDEFYQLYGCAFCSIATHVGTVKVTGDNAIEGVSWVSRDLWSAPAAGTDLRHLGAECITT